MADLNIHLANHDEIQGTVKIVLSGTCDKQIPLHRILTLSLDDFARFMDRAGDVEEIVLAPILDAAFTTSGRVNREAVNVRIAEDDGATDLVV